ncbi:DUF1294 domain-containing protein [uncultured Brevundimonas sp.]|uniref:DUF1294 domain-containing protein n=1 Tax=uncultured Brevundimonas sp. TaxID=213418 RepID=UPI00261989A2|nr:DUF1294 domain-containing protein [uncultured Brevundimonas sp.]
MPLLLFLGFIALANLWAFLAFGFDKVAAVRNERRTSESHLLALTLFGGMGAMGASTLFKHKTRKQPFRRYAEIMALIHIVAVCFFVTLLA